MEREWNSEREREWERERKRVWESERARAREREREREMEPKEEREIEHERKRHQEGEMNPERERETSFLAFNRFEVFNPEPALGIHIPSSTSWTSVLQDEPALKCGNLDPTRFDGEPFDAAKEESDEDDDFHSCRSAFEPFRDPNEEKSVVSTFGPGNLQADLAHEIAAAISAAVDKSKN